MAKYIDKDALVAEIERRIKEYQSTGDDYWFPVIENLKSILSFLDKLEVKDVGLEKEIGKFFGDDDWKASALEEEQRDMIKFAKHFFELGLKAQKGEEV